MFQLNHSGPTKLRKKLQKMRACHSIQETRIRDCYGRAERERRCAARSTASELPLRGYEYKRPLWSEASRSRASDKDFAHNRVHFANGGIEFPCFCVVLALHSALDVSLRGDRHRGVGHNTNIKAVRTPKTAITALLVY